MRVPARLTRKGSIVSLYIFLDFVLKKICIETQFKFLWSWPSKTSLWDSMMLILAAREILYTGLLTSLKYLLGAVRCKGCT